MARGESLLKIQSCSSMSHRAPPAGMLSSQTQRKRWEKDGGRTCNRQRGRWRAGGWGWFLQESSEIWDVIQKKKKM